MSVINNVLKDLESRSSHFTPIDIASVDGGTVEQSSMSRVLVVALAALLAICGLGIWYYQFQSFPVQLVKSSPVVDTAVKPIVVEAETIKSEIIKPDLNQIIGLQIRESTSHISLEFAMREKAVSYLKERAENSFVYHIKNIDSEIETPRISGNRWIEKLSIRDSQQGVDVTLQTVAGVLVNTEQYQKQGETIWTIRLEKLPDPVVVAKLETVVEEPVAEVVPMKVEVIGAVKAPVKVEIKSASEALSEFGQLNKASELMQKAQWQSAETLLLGLVNGPQDFVARKQLLGIYGQPGYSGKYADFTRRSSERYPQQALFKTEYARSLFQQQAYKEAINLLKSVEQLDSKQQALIAASYQRIDQHGKAIEHYHHSLKLNKQDARNWIGLGISLEHEAKLEKALQSYQTAARLGNLNQRLRQFVEQRSRLLKKVIN